MVSEYDLPCTECGHDLIRASIPATEAEVDIQVAECSRCGTRHYPKAALASLRFRTQT